VSETTSLAAAQRAATAQQCWTYSKRAERRARTAAPQNVAAAAVPPVAASRAERAGIDADTVLRGHLPTLSA